MVVLISILVFNGLFVGLLWIKHKDDPDDTSTDDMDESCTYTLYIPY